MCPVRSVTHVSGRSKAELSQRFDAIFTTTTCFALLNRQLARLFAKKAKLLAGKSAIRGATS